MNSISSLSNLQPLVRYSSPVVDHRPAVADQATSSAVVTLSPMSLIAAKQAEASIASQSLPASVRFSKIGAAMLESVKSGTAITLERQPPIEHADNSFELSVVTGSGKKIELALGSLDNELFVQISTDAELEDNERKALVSLAEGFQAAIDGMTKEKPEIHLDEMTGYNSSVLKSIDFRASVTLPTVPPGRQSLEFHIDAKQRSVSIDAPSGKMDVSVNTSTSESLGTRQQQARAIDGYLKQFDQAAQRGHGDLGLVSMFKDAFSQLSHTAIRDDLGQNDMLPGKTWSFSSEERALLTGLADFSATVSQTPQWINPARRDEVSGFQYEASQETRIADDSPADRSIVQAQKSRLVAQFHEPPEQGGKLNFNFSSESQNYTYHEIDDSASSNAELAYKDNRFRKASLEQSVSQSERIREYIAGKMMSDRSVPSEQRLVRDLMAALEPYQSVRELSFSDETRESRDERRQMSLDLLNEDIILLGTSRELVERNQRM